VTLSRQKYIIAAAAILGSAAISLLSAQTAPVHPDFSGTWVLDAARSDSSSFTPKSATWAVLQAGDSIILDRESPGAGKQHAVYALDGSPRSFTLRLVGSGTEAVSTVAWTGRAMVVHTTSHPGDADLVQADTWALSADGKELRIKREATYAGRLMGSPTLVFVKQ
jgi:hypothetical protein